jgi:D-cysteine desulfhydrase
VRKLEFLFAEARDQGADIVLTCGGAQSNHCRATAIAAARLGLGSRLLLRTPDTAAPPAPSANILLDRLVGADIVWVTPAEYRDRARRFETECQALRAAGRRPYVIPEGGSNALGAWGYVRCMEEMLPDLGQPTTVLYAAGSGGTGAGLILGKRLLGLDHVRVVGVNVCDDRAYFVAAIGDIVEDAIKRWQLDIAFSRDEIDLIDGYVGRGYALSRPEELASLVALARSEAIILDPVYTGKAFYALRQELAQRPGSLGERIVFVHTGGIYGLFPPAVGDELAAVL